MTEDSELYNMYCDIITNIYCNAYDEDEAMNTIEKFSKFVEMIDPQGQQSKTPTLVINDFVYFKEDNNEV